MTRDQLISTIDALRIPSSAFSLDGPGGGECYAIEAEGLGWITYYSERGQRSSLRFFPDQSDANADLLMRLRAAFRR